ncbi:MAG: glycosyltransferase [Anaerolineaceae bacterium]
MSNSSFHKRFLIFTSDSGFGHRSAANAVVKALRELHPEETMISLINPLIDLPSPMFIRGIENNYDKLVRNHYKLYKFSYRISDSRRASLLIENSLTLALYRNIKRLIFAYKPDVILTTNLMFNAPTGAVIKRFDLDIPFFTVVTDLAEVHALWFNPSPRRFFVGSDSVRNQAIRYGIPPKKVLVTGIPVDPCLGKYTAEKSRIRQKLSLDPHLTTLLVVGSKRVKGLSNNLKALEKLTYPIQVVVVAGGDDALVEELSHYPWHFPIRIYNFVKNMPELLACSDLLVCKAGGLIVSEGLAAGLPIILVDSLPGQESGNVRFITENQAGVQVRNENEFLAVAQSWLSEDRSTLNTVTDNIRKISRPYSSLEIADVLWQAA